MKDISRLLIYSAAAFLVIVLLASVSTIESLPKGTASVLAIFAVIVAPVAIGILMAKRERSKQQTDSKRQ